MNYALIFAGGVGTRMQTRSKPKQFLELHGKSVIIYTVENFENNSEIDGIVIVCIKEWIEELNKQLVRYDVKKIIKVVPGGSTGHESIYNGLNVLKDICTEDDIVLIHDGVRPLITPKLIRDNIECAKKYKAAITVEALRESIVGCVNGHTISDVPSRTEVLIARAPQTFNFELIWGLHQKAKELGQLTADSTHLCKLYNIPMHIVKSSPNNIKITEPYDYYIFRTLYEVMENQQVELK